MQILERWNVCLFVVGTYLAVSARCQADLPACEVSKACRPPTVIISCHNEPLFLYRRPGSSCAICDSGLALVHTSSLVCTRDIICRALQGRKIFVLDLGIFAESAGLPPCSIDATFRVDPITNVPFLRDDPQVCDSCIPSA